MERRSEAAEPDERGGPLPPQENIHESSSGTDPAGEPVDAPGLLRPGAPVTSDPGRESSAIIKLKGNSVAKAVASYTSYCERKALTEVRAQAFHTRPRSFRSESSSLDMRSRLSISCSIQMGGRRDWCGLRSIEGILAHLFRLEIPAHPSLATGFR